MPTFKALKKDDVLKVHHLNAVTCYRFMPADEIKILIIF
jgi:hypothetical protein